MFSRMALIRVWNARGDSPGVFPLSILLLNVSASQNLCSDPQVSRLRRSRTPQVNCGDTGEGELRDAPGRQREARYGQGERRCVSPARLRRTFQERNALMKGASPFMTDRSRQDSPLSDGSPRFPASTPQFCSPFPLPRPFGNAPAALPVHPAEKSVCLQMLTDPFGYPESCPENIMFKIRNFHSIS